MPNPSRPRPPCRAALAALVLALAWPTTTLGEGNPATVSELPSVEVISTVPLPELGLPLRQVPGNVQTLGGDALDRQRPHDLAEALARNLGSVSINDTQGNAAQVDLSFRGFTASPVLGTPQGISVFVDGVRVNEAFGDTVNWDLIPPAALANLTLIPGSDPVFGLNTLGGALSINTRSGFADPGTTVGAEAGSFGRRSLDVATGGHGEHIDYFGAASARDDQGWAQHNPSHIRQLFAKTGYEDARTDIDLSATLASTRLEGSQTLPGSMLGDPSQSYTWPDTGQNRLAFFHLKASRFLSRELLLAAGAYQRDLTTDLLNSNVNGNFDPASPIGPGNQPTGNAIDHIAQRRSGMSLQLTASQPLAGLANRASVGLSLDRGRTGFLQYNQEAGAARDTASSAPQVLATHLDATDSQFGLYATDNLGLGSDTFLTVSGRYNAAALQLTDRLGSALDGSHAFRRFNPGLGLTHNPQPGLTLFADLSTGLRVPTPVELACADRNAPCSLPNAFAADPALRPVRSRSGELGARGRAGSLAWSTAVFQTTLDDDIQFVSSGGGAVSSGYFQNVGRTRRQGLELSLAAPLGNLHLATHYSLVQATYRSAMILASPDNSSAAPLTCAGCTDIAVHPGNRLPGVPLHNLKLRGDLALDGRSDLGLTVQVQSGQYARGDENQGDVHGAIPGFALFHLDGERDLGGGWQAFARVDNLFDRRYASFGVLGLNVFTAPGGTFDASGASWRAEQFRTAGAPRALWVGLRYRIGAGTPAGNDD